MILLILLTWLVWFAVFSGVGMLFTRRADLLAFWAGWALTIGFLQVWSFVYPVNDVARLLVFVTAVAGLVIHRKQWMQHYDWRFLSVVLVFGLWVASRSLLAPTTFDTGLYHLNVVRWALEYPVVPGLGLLHTRLAFSNAFFLYPALLNVGPWVDQTYHIANGLLFVVLFAHCASFYKQNDRAGWFHLLFIPVIVFLLLTGRVVPGISNDPAVFALGVVVGGLVLSRKTELWVVVLLCSVGIAIKFSFGVLGVGFALLTLNDTLRHASIKPLALPVLVAALIFIPMMGRSVLMTGYPLYPSVIAPFDVDWRIPLSFAKADSDTIRAFALDSTRPPDEVLADWSWFGGWLRAVVEEYFHVLIPLALMLVSVVVLVRKRAEVTDVYRQAAFLLILFLSLVFWFFTLPNIRFAVINFWLLAIGLVTLALNRRYILIGLMVILLLPSVRLFIRDPWVEGDLQPITTPDLERFTTESGLELWIPAEGGQQCWDSPLPCMAFPSAGLRLRVDGDLRQGFKR